MYFLMHVLAQGPLEYVFACGIIGINFSIKRVKLFSKVIYKILTLSLYGFHYFATFLPK
jgi:hypothetical protein